MAYTRITKENQAAFPVGTRVRFNYGAMFPTEEGVITGCGATRWGAYLTAETEAGRVEHINAFTTVGVGVYVIGPPEEIAARAARYVWQAGELAQ